MHNLRDAITFEKATEILGCTKPYLSHLVRDGVLEAHKINQHMNLYERSDVIRLAYEIKRGTRRSHPKRAGKPDMKVNGKPVLITDGINSVDAARIAGISRPEYMCALARMGLVKAIKMHKRGWVFSRKDVERYRDNKGTTGRPRSGPGEY